MKTFKKTIGFVLVTVLSLAHVTTQSNVLDWAREYKKELGLGALGLAGAAAGAYGAKKAYDYKKQGGSFESFKDLVQEKAQHAWQGAKEGAENLGKYTGILYETTVEESVPVSGRSSKGASLADMSSKSQQLQQHAAEFQQEASSLKERMKAEADKPWYKL